jgi:hypothetical protein
MKIAVLGDSFVRLFWHTWIEQVCKHFEWQVILHQGFPGGAEYYFLESLTDLLNSRDDIDLVIFAHTEPSRLPNNQHLGINYVTVTQPKEPRVSQETYEAAKAYYDNLYYERFHLDIHALIVAEIQRICKERNIRQIHLQSFDQPLPRNHGMWMTNGLYNVADELQPEGWQLNKELRNHFVPELHDKFAAWLITHLRYYLDSKTDLHIVNLSPEDLR